MKHIAIKSHKEIAVLKLLSVTAIAATLLSPATAAQLNTPHITPHINVVTGNGQVGRIHGGFANSDFTTPKSNLTTPKYRRWVCGPIVNYDGTPHCHWTT
jgi:opacity protein-like surface antigen